MKKKYNFQQQNISWWLWYATLETQHNEVLLYATLLRNNTKFPPEIDSDKGEFNIDIGKVRYCSRLIDETDVEKFTLEIYKSNSLKFGLLEPSLSNEFDISATRNIIDKTFGKSVVSIKSYYTAPDLSIWDNDLDGLKHILLMLKNELNLPFDSSYARKFGNFEIHDMTIAIDSSLIVGIMNSESGRGYVRVAKKAPLLDKNQQLHVICRASKDVIYHKLVLLEKGKSVTILDDLPENSFELECWVFDESGSVIFQEHQHYIASIGMNIGVSNRQVKLEDKLTSRAETLNKELGNKVSIVNRTTTESSIIQPHRNQYEKFNEQMIQIQSDLFNAQGDDRWFGKSIECEVDVIKHFQSILAGGKARKAIVVDPFFGAESFERFVTRVEESKLELIILTSLSDINPDSGTKFSAESNPIDLLKRSILKVKDLINCNLRLVNVNRGNSKQAFHDRYLVVYPYDGLPVVYMLSNSINKMSGNWPFCMSKLEPAIGRHVREYIEQLCKGKDNSREGNPNITYEWPENG